MPRPRSVCVASTNECRASCAADVRIFRTDPASAHAQDVPRKHPGATGGLEGGRRHSHRVGAAHRGSQHMRTRADREEATVPVIILEIVAIALLAFLGGYFATDFIALTFEVLPMLKGGRDSGRHSPLFRAAPTRVIARAPAQRPGFGILPRTTAVSTPGTGNELCWVCGTRMDHGDHRHE